MSNEITVKSLTYVEVEQDFFRLTEFEGIAVSKPVTITATDTDISLTDGRNHSFLSMSAGPLFAGRKVVLLISQMNVIDGNTTTINSVFMNGASPNHLLRATGDNTIALNFFILEDDTTELFDISVVFSNTSISRVGAQLFALSDADLQPIAKRSTTIAASGAGPFSLAFSVPVNAAALVAAVRNNVSSATWTGFTEVTDTPFTPENGTTTAATYTTSIAATLNASVSIGSGDGVHASPFAGMVWGPTELPVQPKHWEKNWSTNVQFYGIDNEAFPTGKGMRVVKTDDTANSFVRWEIVPNMTDLSIVALFNFVSSPEGGLVLRAAGTAAAPRGYRCRITSTGATIDKANGGAFSTLTTLTQTFGTDENIWMRFDAITISGGVTLRAKIWTGDLGDEPDIFTFSVDDTSTPVDANGRSGLYISTLNSTYDVGHYHVRSMLNNSLETITYAMPTDYVHSGPAGPAVIPSIMAAKVTPAEVSLGENLGRRASVSITFKDHQYADLGELYDRGSYWGKYRGRGLFRRGNDLRLRHGHMELDLEDFDTRNFILESFSGPTFAGTFDLVAQDVLKMADNDRAQCPVVSDGFLSATLTNVATTFTVLPSGIGDLQYPASGYVAVGGEEIMSFTRVGDNFTVTRGQFGTTAVEHNDEDRVQLCVYYNAQTAAAILRDLYVTYARIDSSLIDIDAWELEVSTYLQRLYTRLIAEPTGVNQLASELIQQAGLASWFDDRDNQLRLQVLRGVSTTSFLYDQPAVIRGSLSVAEQPDKRITQVWTYYGVRNPLQSLTEANNYRSTSAVIATETESENGEAVIKKIFGTWIPSFGRSTADRVNDLFINRFKTPPRAFSFELSRYSGVQEPELGGGYQITWWGNQDAAGNQINAPIQVTRIEPLADRWRVNAEEMLYSSSSASDLINRVITIDTNEFNLNLKTLHDSIFPAITEDDLGSEGVTVTFLIASGVTVGSTAVGMPSIDVGDWPVLPPLRLTNRGRIQGKGGDGGKGRISGIHSTSYNDGNPGGTALYTREPISVDNAGGQIYGGAGGGKGGEGSTFSAPSFLFAGGGGGGAGTNPGAGGEGYNSDDGLPGTADAGGARGVGSGVVASGDGGDPGQAGDGPDGGAAGNAIDGVSFITFIAAGTRVGPEIN